jgi:hypothetical protein
MPMAAVKPPPIFVAVAPAAPQSRLTVFFRNLMVLPHGVVLGFVGIAAEFVQFIGWWGALFTGQLPEFAYNFQSGYLRWATRVNAYQSLLTDVYPPFSLDEEPTYPVRLAIPPRQRLNRAAVFFRGWLIIPAGLVAAFLGFGAYTLLLFVAWLIALFTGRLPESFHLAYVAVLRFQIRVTGYALLLTAAYPGGLFGDRPDAPVWPDGPVVAQAAAFGAPAAAYGAPAPSYGTPAPQGYGAPQAPGAPQGYGTPQAPGAPQGYGTPQAPGAPQDGGAPQGWGTPPGYGSGGTAQGYGNGSF